jgi:ribosome-binding factor A
MKTRRIERINSLLRRVISEVIMIEVKNPHMPGFISITRVETANDLQHAKVYVSIIGDSDTKNKAMKLLKSSAGFISSMASKKVSLRFFPELLFILDDSVEQQMKIMDLIANIENERNKRIENA